jgi:uncharacterized protein (TIGR00369 family)
MAVKLNPEHIRSLVALTNEGPYFRLLSIEVLDIGPGFSRSRVALREKHRNPFGMIHGGVYASLVDTGAYLAVYCDLEEDAGLVTLDLSVHNLAKARDGFLFVEGKRIKAGRNICLAEATITDEGGKLIAHGTSKQMVTPGLQTMAQAAAAMGRPPLPPKFLPGA